MFSTTIDGQPYNLSTRLVVTPHFSYNTNFLPQFRLSETDWNAFASRFPACAQFLQTDKTFQFTAAQVDSYAVCQIPQNTQTVLTALKNQYADAWPSLQSYYYDAHQMMADVLHDLYNANRLTCPPPTGTNPQHLARSAGACCFCVNSRWQFPSGCPYAKPQEPAPPVGFLEKVATAMVAAGVAARI